jgi:hypothetical protein
MALVLRQQVDRAQMVENNNPNWKDLPEDPRDVVLILKQCLGFFLYLKLVFLLHLLLLDTSLNY